MEQPFTQTEFEEIKNVVDWIYNRTEFGDFCPDLPGGKNPKELLQDWAQWVMETIEFMDGDGAMRRYKYGNNYSEQPALDVEIYRRIRGEWIRHRNEGMKAKVK